MNEMYYFGSWHQSGMGLHGPDCRWPREIAGWPWREGELDTKYAPQVGKRADHYLSIREQPQGVAAVVHYKGWTVLAFWDRSGADKRGLINSSFITRGELDFEAVWAMAQKVFPTVTGRFPFEVVEFVSGDA